MHANITCWYVTIIATESELWQSPDAVARTANSTHQLETKRQKSEGEERKEKEQRE